jgi:hypothetical protein
MVFVKNGISYRPLIKTIGRNQCVENLVEYLKKETKEKCSKVKTSFSVNPITRDYAISFEETIESYCEENGYRKTIAHVKTPEFLYNEMYRLNREETEEKVVSICSRIENRKKEEEKKKKYSDLKLLEPLDLKESQKKVFFGIKDPNDFKIKLELAPNNKDDIKVVENKNRLSMLSLFDQQNIMFSDYKFKNKSELRTILANVSTDISSNLSKVRLRDNRDQWFAYSEDMNVFSTLFFPFNLFKRLGYLFESQEEFEKRFIKVTIVNINNINITSNNNNNLNLSSLEEGIE